MQSKAIDEVLDLHNEPSAIEQFRAIKQQLSRLPQCDECPLQGRPRVPFEGVPGGLAIIGEAPGGTEARKGRPFVGKSGKLLRATLDECDAGERVMFLNTCECRPEGNATPSASAIEACHGRLIEDLQRMQPHTILAVGAPAASTLMGESVSITNSRGFGFHHKEAGANVVLTIHPAYCLRREETFTWLVRDIQKALRLEDAGPIKPPPAPAWQTCRTAGDIHRGLQVPSGQVVLDIETTGLHPTKDEIVAIGLATAGSVVIIPQELVYADITQDMLQTLQDRLDVELVGQNFKFDARMVEAQLGVQLDCAFDTMLAHYAITEVQGSHSLEQIAGYYLNAPDYGGEVSRMLKAGEAKEIDEEDLHLYLARDVRYTYDVVEPLQEELESEGTADVLHDVLVPASNELARLEARGAPIDREGLWALEHHFGQQVDELREILDKIAADHDINEFNPMSTNDCNELFYDRMGMRTHGRHGRSTARQVFEEIEHTLPGTPRKFFEALLGYRQARKMQRTFVETLIDVSDEERVYPSFRLHGTRTGRLSCTQPNLLNIPHRVGSMVRDIFIAPEGWKVLYCDFSQLEMRVMAFLSGDEALTEVYKAGQDVHDITTMMLYDLDDPSEATETQRFFAKMLNFSVAYGRSAKSLAAQQEGALDCTVEEAQAYLDKFHNEHPELMQWREENFQKALKTGIIETYFGRKRRVPLVANRASRSRLERLAGNTPIQGTASDINLLAFIRLSKLLDPDVAYPTFMVHDSIAFVVREDVLDETLVTIVDAMEAVPFETNVPFLVDAEVGDRWGSLDKVDMDHLRKAGEVRTKED